MKQFKNSICKVLAGIYEHSDEVERYHGCNKTTYGTTLRSLFDQTQGRHDE